MSQATGSARELKTEDHIQPKTDYSVTARKKVPTTSHAALHANSEVWNTSMGLWDGGVELKLLKGESGTNKGFM